MRILGIINVIGRPPSAVQTLPRRVGIGTGGHHQRGGPVVGFRYDPADDDFAREIGFVGLSPPVLLARAFGNVVVFVQDFEVGQHGGNVLEAGDVRPPKAGDVLFGPRR